MTNLFTGTLSHIGDTLTAEVAGFTLTARVERDDCAGAPWQQFDGHGIVSDWMNRIEWPVGQLILCQDGNMFRYYDMAATMEKAKRDGWDAAPFGGTKSERAKRAVEADFKRLRAWVKDEWTYVTVVVGVSRNGITLDDYAASLSGIESDAGEYLTETANDLAVDALACGKALLAKLCAT